MDETKFITLRESGGEPGLVANSLGRAVESLDELGLCMNWANLSRGPHTTVLLYEGWTYRHSHERFVALPFNADTPNFEEELTGLLRQIFLPFFPNLDYTHDSVQRSLIHVIPHPTEKQCFLVTIVLVMQDKSTGTGYRQIAETLDKVDDGSEPNQGLIFWLD